MNNNVKNNSEEKDHTLEFQIDSTNSIDGDSQLGLDLKNSTDDDNDENSQLGLDLTSERVGFAKCLSRVRGQTELQHFGGCKSVDLDPKQNCTDLTVDTVSGKTDLPIQNFLNHLPDDVDTITRVVGTTEIPIPKVQNDIFGFECDLCDHMIIPIKYLCYSFKYHSDPGIPAPTSNQTETSVQLILDKCEYFEESSDDSSTSNSDDENAPASKVVTTELIFYKQIDREDSEGSSESSVCVNVQQTVEQDEGRPKILAKMVKHRGVTAAKYSPPEQDEEKSGDPKKNVCIETLPLVRDAQNKNIASALVHGYIQDGNENLHRPYKILIRNTGRGKDSSISYTLVPIKPVPQSDKATSGEKTDVLTEEQLQECFDKLCPEDVAKTTSHDEPTKTPKSALKTRARGGELPESHSQPKKIQLKGPIDVIKYDELADYIRTIGGEDHRTQSVQVSAENLAKKSPFDDTIIVLINDPEKEQRLIQKQVQEALRKKKSEKKAAVGGKSSSNKRPTRKVCCEDFKKLVDSGELFGYECVEIDTGKKKQKPKNEVPENVADLPPPVETSAEPPSKPEADSDASKKVTESTIPDSTSDLDANFLEVTKKYEEACRRYENFLKQCNAKNDDPNTKNPINIAIYTKEDGRIQEQKLACTKVDKAIGDECVKKYYVTKTVSVDATDMIIDGNLVGGSDGKKKDNNRPGTSTATKATSDSANYDGLEKKSSVEVLCNKVDKSIKNLQQTIKSITTNDVATNKNLDTPKLTNDTSFASQKSCNTSKKFAPNDKVVATPGSISLATNSSKQGEGNNKTNTFAANTTAIKKDSAMTGTEKALTKSVSVSFSDMKELPEDNKVPYGIEMSAVKNKTEAQKEDLEEAKKLLDKKPQKTKTKKNTEGLSRLKEALDGNPQLTMLDACDLEGCSGFEMVKDGKTIKFNKYCKRKPGRSHYYGCADNENIHGYACSATGIPTIEYSHDENHPLGINYFFHF